MLQGKRLIRSQEVSYNMSCSCTNNLLHKSLACELGSERGSGSSVLRSPLWDSLGAWPSLFELQGGPRGWGATGI